jgi:hypothetical protein
MVAALVARHGRPREGPRGRPSALGSLSVARVPPILQAGVAHHLARSAPQEPGLMGDKFERDERQLFGAGRFDVARDQVQALEQQLGINDLTQFTPA